MITLFQIFTSHFRDLSTALPFCLQSFFAEFSIYLTMALCIYYFCTLKKRYMVQTVLGVSGAVALLIFYCRTYFFIHERIFEVMDGIQHLPSSFKISPFVFWIDFCLAGPMAVAALAALIVCIINLVHQRQFSKRQILCISIPLWVCLATHEAISLCIGRPLNRLIGIPELVLALLLTLTLFAKKAVESHGYQYRVHAG